MPERTERTTINIWFFIAGIFLGGFALFLSILDTPYFYTVWTIVIIIFIIMSIFLKKTRFLWIGCIVGIISSYSLILYEFSQIDWMFL